MQAIVFQRFGPPDVLQLKGVEKPVPNADEVLVKIRAASVNIADYHRMRGVPFLVRLLFAPARADGLRGPKDPRLGTDIAGQVEAVGNKVTQFKTGDEVFGVCKGGFAEYASTREVNLVLKPANTSFEQAATIPVAAVTALQGLRNKGQIQAGQKVLINGASGGVGTFAVQIAKSFGVEVTAVCSPRNLDQARSIGADHVIDYTKEDFTKNGQHYDLILAVNGYKPISAYKRILSPEGVYVLAGASGTHIYQALIEATLLGRLGSSNRGQKIGFMGIAKLNHTDLVFLQELLQAGKLVPVIENRYPLSETANALRYIGEGHARGKLIITFD